MALDLAPLAKRHLPDRSVTAAFTDAWHSAEGLLLRRLLLVLVVYSVVRVTFLFDHFDRFRAVDTAVIIGALFRGLRFDLSAVTYSNAPFILLSLAPDFVARRAWYRRSLFALFVGVNGVLAMLMIADVGYYPFTGARATLDDFALTTAVSQQATQLLASFAGLTVLALALTVALFLFYPRERSTGSARPRSGSRTTLVALAAVALAVIAARGGLQRKPLAPINAFSGGRHEIGDLTLNTAFTLLHSDVGGQLAPVRFFPSDQEAEAILRTPPSPVSPLVAGGFPSRQNVIVLVLESIGTEFWGAADRSDTLTPFLDSLAQQGAFFRSSFSNGRRSIDALPSILLGVPLLMGRSLAVSNYQANEWRGLGDFLGGRGYGSSMFHGAVKGTMYFDAIAAMAGIQSFYSIESYPDSLRARDSDGHWGLYDEPWMQWAAKEMGTFQEPFFSLIFTISTHHPYRLPPSMEGVFPRGAKEIHASVRYLDHSVRRFFEAARNEPWYENTLFILTGDHAAPERSPRFDTPLGQFMVPLLLFHPRGRIPQVDARRISQHVDLLPTILEYTGTPTGRVPLFGRSLFDRSTGEAVLQAKGTYWLVREDVVLQRTPNGGEEIFAQVGERTGVGPALAMGTDIRRGLNNRLNAYVQHYTSSMIHNSFYTDSAQRLIGRAKQE